MENLYKRDSTIEAAFEVIPYIDEQDIIETEVEYALKYIANGKSPGCDEIPIVLVKAGEEETVKTLTALCNAIWIAKEWPED